MRTQPPDHFTQNEWRVMQIVWRLKKCSAREVYDIAGREYGWAPTTAKTYLSVLVDKGRLKTTRVGNSFLYQPKVSFLQSLKKAADGLLEKTLGGNDGPLLAYLIKRSSLSPDDIAELRELLAKAEGKTTSGKPE